MTELLSDLSDRQLLQLIELTQRRLALLRNAQKIRALIQKAPQKPGWTRKRNLEIKRLRQNGLTYRQLGKRFGLTPSSICRIIKHLDHQDRRSQRWHEEDAKIVHLPRPPPRITSP